LVDDRDDDLRSPSIAAIETATSGSAYRLALDVSNFPRATDDVLSSDIHDHIHLLKLGLVVDPIPGRLVPPVDVSILIGDIDGRDT
jgi:hypothetical protein